MFSGSIPWLLLMQGFDTILSDMLQFTNGINDVSGTQQGDCGNLCNSFHCAITCSQHI